MAEFRALQEDSWVEIHSDGSETKLRNRELGVSVHNGPSASVSGGRTCTMDGTRSSGNTLRSPPIMRPVGSGTRWLSRFREFGNQVKNTVVKVFEESQKYNIHQDREVVRFSERPLTEARLYSTPQSTCQVQPQSTRENARVQVGAQQVSSRNDRTGAVSQSRVPTQSRGQGAVAAAAARLNTQRPQGHNSQDLEVQKLQTRVEMLEKEKQQQRKQLHEAARQVNDFQMHAAMCESQLVAATESEKQNRDELRKKEQEILAQLQKNDQAVNVGHPVKTRLCSVTLELGNELIGRIFQTKLVEQIQDIATAESTSCQVANCTIAISGSCPDAVIRVKERVEELLGQVISTVESELLLIHCMYFPVLINPDTSQAVRESEQKNCVSITILQKSGDAVSIGQLANEWGHNQSLVRVCDLSNYTISNTPTPMIWMVQHQCVPPDMNAFFNECCYTSLDSSQFFYQDVQYHVDFTNDVLTEVVNGSAYQLVKQPHPISWSYSLTEDQYMTHEPHDSQAVEHMYQYGGEDVMLAGNRHIFNLRDPNAMFQIDVTTGRQVHLRRDPLPTSSELPQHDIVLGINGLPDDISRAKRHLEQQLSVEKRQLFVEGGVAVFDQVLNRARQYCIRLNTSSQNTGRICIELSGDCHYVDKVCLELRQQLDPSVPREWEKQTENVELKLVQLNSPEWQMVLQQMRKTMPNIRIEMLQRVQNKPLWEKYSLEMKHMEERNNGEINEKYLFHGTRKTDPEQIVKTDKGIDFRFRSLNCRLLWGEGSYLAANASYSNHYRYPHPVFPGYNKMLLVRVLTGRSFSYDETHNDATYSLTKPPPLPHSQQPQSTGATRLYDTVNGYTNGSYVYVVYDHDKSYPAYIITYCADS